MLGLILVLNLLLTIPAHSSSTSQPAHSELEFTSKTCVEAGLDANQQQRITGGCANLTFCNRGQSYGSGQYGYKHSRVNGCVSPGPIIRLKPGFTYGVVFCVEAEGQILDHPGSNMHTHGIHISGCGNSDDITRWTASGSCSFYEYVIPANHMGGTMWYHPHLHTQTKQQVSGGCFGLILIDDQDQQDKTVDPSVGTESDRKKVYNFLTDRSRELILLASYDTVAKTWSNTNEDGNSNKYTILAETWYRLRILTVNANGVPETVTIPSACSAHALSHDGVYRFNPPKAASSVFYLSGASRLDVAIKCPEGVYEITMSAGYLQKKRFDGMTDGENQWDGDTWAGSPTVAILTVIPPSEPDTLSPFLSGNQQWKSCRPDYLLDFRSEPVGNKFSVTIARGTNWQVNGITYNPNCALKNNGLNFLADLLNEWALISPAHPHHLHLYHQQVQTPGCGIGHDEGEYYDVIADAGSSGNCTVRFKTADHGGRTTLHCHILSHEDGGAMGWVNVVGHDSLTSITPCCIHGSCSECVAEDSLPDMCAADSRHHDDHVGVMQQDVSVPDSSSPVPSSTNWLIVGIGVGSALLAVTVLVLVIVRKFGPGMMGYQSI